MNAIETFEHAPNQNPIIIFERVKKEEAEQALKRLNQQNQRQKEIQARIQKKLGQEDKSNEPTKTPAS